MLVITTVCGSMGEPQEKEMQVLVIKKKKKKKERGRTTSTELMRVKEIWVKPKEYLPKESPFRQTLQCFPLGSMPVMSR